MIFLNVRKQLILITNQWIYKYMQILVINVNIVVVANTLDKEND
jgi:hypothetical protein